MIFTNPRQYKSYIPTNQPATHNQRTLVMQRPYTPIAPVVPKSVTPDPNEPPPPKPMKWGEPTWYFFHTLAEKVKPSSFAKVRSELLSLITLICNNLPCPVCTEHAKQYLNGINYNTIQTKEHLKQLLFEFHNVVNKRKGYPEFNRGLLDEKYSKAITVNIVHNFMTVYEKRTRGFKLLSDEIQRSRIMEHLKVWLIANLIHFDT